MIVRNTIKFFGAILPQTVPELIYVNLPPFLKKPLNRLLCSFIPEYLKVGSVEIAMNREDPVVCGALTLGMYEKSESRLLQEKLKLGMTVIDIGANVGLYTALAASIVGAEGQVYAFEPAEVNFAFLQKTVAKNGFTNTECYKVAISDHNGKGELFLSTENLAAHHIYDSKEGRRSVVIDLMTLDTFLETHVVTKVDFLKMDIEGSEGLALKGMERMLQRNPNIQIFTEFTPRGFTQTGESALEFLRTLKRHGFSIFEINRSTGTLRKVTDIESFSGHFHGREFANLYCTK